jgi:hypothetical protein
MLEQLELFFKILLKISEGLPKFKKGRLGKRMVEISLTFDNLIRNGATILDYMRELKRTENKDHADSLSIWIYESFLRQKLLLGDLLRQIESEDMIKLISVQEKQLSMRLHLIINWKRERIGRVVGPDCNPEPILFKANLSKEFIERMIDLEMDEEDLWRYEIEAHERGSRNYDLIELDPRNKDKLINQINVLDIAKGKKSLANLTTCSEQFKKIIRDNFKIEDII